MSAITLSFSKENSLNSNTNEAYNLSTKQINAFEENGYLPIERITRASDVAFIKAQLQDLFDRRAGFDEGAFIDFAGTEETGAEAKAPQLLGPERYAPQLRKSEFFRNSKAVAEQILGPGVQLKQSHAILKPARSGAATPWHQDEAFGDPKLDYHEINFWLALQPVNATNSCMRFIPGSNHWPVVPHALPGNNSRVHAVDCSAMIDESAAVDCPLQAGGCSLHTTKTVHGAGPNSSDEARWAYILTWGLPPTPHQGERTYPWLAHRQTEGQARRRKWLMRGGIFIAVWRRLRARLVI